jgi:oxygen-independent coproporphyrinogen-3 oxidase
VDSRDRQDQFVDRLCRELELTHRWWPGALETIFVGGGTPTLLAPASWETILGVLGRLVRRAPGLEFTVEANPETVERDLLEVLGSGGVDRLSIGAQSFHGPSLKMLERQHDPARVARSIDLARAVGIDNVNVDLIFAIPGQTLEEWLEDLETVLSLEPDHLSCYGLMYEPNTALTARLRAGTVERAEEDLEAAMYEATIDRLEAAGFEHYEISNWARPGRRCRHNELYWTNEQWWPIGPSAAGHAAGWRWKNAPHLGRYLEDLDALPPIEGAECLDEDGRVAEAIMLGLRRLEGITDADVEALLGRGTRGEARRTAIARNIDANMLTVEGGRLRLTRAGLMLADGVIAELM